MACVAAGATRSVVLVPYFLSAGTHVRRDLTEARKRGWRHGFQKWSFKLAEPLGRHPFLAEVVVVERVRETTGANDE